MSEQITAVIPHLTCRNAAEAIEFYKKAFGAEAAFVMPGPDGKVMHATMKLGPGVFHVNDEFVEHGAKGPQTIGGTPVTIHLQAVDCDVVFAQAVEVGCTVLMPLEDQFWGDRYGMLSDPYGHQWSVATTKKQLSVEEVQAAMANMGGAECGVPA